jgi:hypothetical protein
VSIVKGKICANELSKVSVMRKVEGPTVPLKLNETYNEVVVFVKICTIKKNLAQDIKVLTHTLWLLISPIGTQLK